MSFYRFARAVVLSLCKVVFRVKVRGTENVPRSGAYIVAPTHRSNLDTPFAAFVTTRRIRFMAKQELFRHPVGDKLFTALGGVSVERGSPSSRAALKAIQAALADGEPVAVFPEGTRRHGREVTDLFDGTAYLAVKLGVPIVPVGIGGSEEILASGKKLPRLRRVGVVVGPPIVASPDATTRKRSDLAAITAELQEELQRLFDEAMELVGYRSV
ncbi:MAG TPA: lysophospholipid acyltransferase family protein [Acidimicrobiia bacterium]